MKRSRLNQGWYRAPALVGLAMLVAMPLASAKGQIPFQLEQHSGNMSGGELANQVEEDLFHLINEQRAKKKLGSLSEEKDLDAIALSHSKDMLKRNYMSHFSPEGKSVVDRYSKYDPKIQRSLGENIHTIESSSGLHDPRAIAEVMVKDWMNSSGHRKNILAKKYEFEGLGCASDGTRIFCTQVFASPKGR